MLFKPYFFLKQSNYVRMQYGNSRLTCRYPKRGLKWHEFWVGTAIIQLRNYARAFIQHCIFFILQAFVYSFAQSFLKILVTECFFKKIASQYTKFQRDIKEKMYNGIIYNVITYTKKYLQPDWLRGVQYWPHLYSVFNICTL